MSKACSLCHKPIDIENDHYVAFSYRWPSNRRDSDKAWNALSEVFPTLICKDCGESLTDVMDGRKKLIFSEKEA